MRTINYSAGLSALLLTATLACESDLAQEETLSSTGLELSVDVLAGTDVGGVRFEISRVSCSGEEFTPLNISVDHDLEDILIPGGIAGLENQPLDDESSHLFSDAFFSLPAGCYSITATPLTAEGEVSVDCAPASRGSVTVSEGSTTEILLVNQCTGESTGALDVISALNHPPEITSLTLDPSKFTETCTPVTACATVSDADSDPLELLWDATGDLKRLEVISTVALEDGSIRQCAEIELGSAGTLQVTVSAFDLFQDEAGPVRVETWLNDAGYPNESRASLTFPVHGSGDPCPACTAPENVATAAKLAENGGSATESSHEGGNYYGYAIDGDPNTAWTSYTVGAGQLLLDLGRVFDLSEIALYNRADCCVERLSGYHLEVSLDGSSWTPVTGGVITETAGFPSSFPADFDARYVRVRDDAPGAYFNVAEIHVFADDGCL